MSVELDELDPLPSNEMEQAANEDGEGFVPPAEPSGEPRPRYGSRELFDEGSSFTSGTSNSEVWFHQAASEGNLQQVKAYINELKRGDYLRFIAERDLLINNYSALHIAARYNKVDVVKYLLDNDAPIDQKDTEDENTPLLLAIKYNSEETAKKLLMRNADPCATNKYGTHALHFAARRGNKTLCEEILNKPCVKLNEQLDKSGGTALHSAVLGGNEEVVELLIRRGADVVAKNNEEEQPIHLAAAEDHSDIIVLLAKGAICIFPEDQRRQAQIDFVNAVTGEKDTALHIAAQGGYLETVKTLISIGARVNMRTDTNQTPLHLAAIGGQVEVARYLVMNNGKVGLKDSDQMTPLHKAAQFGRLETVKFLLERGSRDDARDRDGFTPLMCAVWKGHNDVIQYMLERDPKRANRLLSINDINSKCVLHLAIEEDCYETLELLLKGEGKKLINDTDKDYRSCVHYAAEKESDQILNLLLDNGGTIDKSDIDEKTPLHTASEKGNLSCVKCLAKKAPGIINATDAKGMSALHLAAMNGHIKVSEVLIELGAETSSRDELNWTPLDYAARYGYSKTMKVLLDNEAKVDAMDTNNATPLQHASQYGHVDCINMLLDQGASISCVNNEMKNCLDLAVENYQKDACLALIYHPRWEEIMKHLYKDKPHPMENLIRYAPEIAEIVLNNCIKKVDLKIPGRKECKTVYDFKYLYIPPEQQNSGAPYFGPSTMVKYRKSNLLQHPVTVKLINAKWGRLGRWVYICSLTSYILFVTLLTSLVAVEKDHDQDLKEKSNNTVRDVCENRGNNKVFFQVVPWLTLGVASFQIIKELIQALYLGKRYLKDIVNWFEFILYGSTFMFMLPFILCQVGGYSDEQYLDDLKWTAGAISILCAWFNFLLYLKRAPVFGIYVLMFIEVLSTLLTVLAVFSILIIAFALSFYCLLKVPDELATSDDGNTAFNHVGTGIVRTMVMMIGELDYRATFTEKFEEDKKKYLPYKGMGYVVFVLFVIVMTIVVMNLLVGLAIGDIEAVRKNSYIRMLRGQVRILEILDRTYPKWILSKFYKSHIEELPRKRMNRWERFTDWLNSVDFDNLQEEQNDLTTHEMKVQEEVQLQCKELEKVKQKMKVLTSGVEEQSEMLKRVMEVLRKIPKDELQILITQTHKR